MLEQENPLWQLFTFIVLSRNHLYLEQNFNQLWHNIGEASDTNDQNEGHNDALDLTLRVKVSKTHSWHRSEHKVHDDRNVFKSGQLTQPIHIEERVFVSVLGSMLWHDKPHSTEKVSQEQDKYDQAEDLEEFNQKDLLHDFVVVESSILDAHLIAMYTLDYFFSIDATNKASKVLHIEQYHHIRRTEKAQQKNEAGIFGWHGIFESKVERPGRASYKVEDKATLNIFLGNFLEVSDRPARV